MTKSLNSAPHPRQFTRTRTWGYAGLLCLVHAITASPPCATAQFMLPRGPVELAGELQIDQIDSATRSHLERGWAFLEGGQYQDAVETWLRLVEEQGNKLALVADPHRPNYQRFVTLRRAIDLQLLQASRTTPQILDVYRAVVDPLAERWASSGELNRVVDELFLSSPADEALDALAQQALRGGRFAQARLYWERLFSPLRTGAYGAAVDTLPDNPLWMALTPNTMETVLRQFQPGAEAPVDTARTWLYYPDSDLSLPAIQARLVLVSILEGDRSRAELELQLYRALHPQATGVWGGESVVFADALEQMLKDSHDWVQAPPRTDWPTFAGNYQRNGRAAPLGDLHPLPLWKVPLTADYARSPLDAVTEQELGFPGIRAGEHGQEALPFFPIVVDGRVYVSEGARIRAFGLIDGASQSPVSDEGEIYALPEAMRSGQVRPGQLGTPRFLPSASRRLLVECLGAPVTIRANQVAERSSPQQLVALDLATQRVVLLLPPGSESWTFESGPIVEHGHIYVAMRRSDVQSEVHVACFEIATQRMVWRTMICSGASLGGGETHEITHNVLCLHEDMLYINTNLGAVAALDRHQGTIQWLVGYPRSGTVRATEVHPAWHVLRDVTPCLYDRGMLYVAPMDCALLFCLDALSGHVLWEARLPEGVFDGSHLVGAIGDHLIASGRRLWWFDRRDGRLSSHVVQNPFPPAGHSEPHGAGRAMLAGQTVYWPVSGERDEIFLIDAADGRMVRQPVRLPDGLRAGNLCASQGILVVASEDHLYALDARPPAPADD